MRRAVTYTHQAGADGTNTPHPSKKNFSLLLGPPTYIIRSLLLYVWCTVRNESHSEQCTTHTHQYRPNNICSHTIEKPHRCILIDYFYNYKTLASSNNALPDDGDCGKTCRTSFNVNFNILLKQLCCASVGK